MRVYIPAVSTDLLDDRPPLGPGFSVMAPAGVAPEDIEVLEDDAQTEAALASLTRLREASAGERIARVVLAADADDPHVAVIDPADATSRIAEVAPGQLTWDDVVAILADPDDAEPAARAVLEARDQDEADQAVADLWLHALEWFDITERETLTTHWFSTHPSV